MSPLFAPPSEVTWYHALWLEAAEAGRLTYDFARYPIHAVNPNVVRCIWCGLLADGPEGPVITPLGQQLLNAYRATRPAPEPEPARSAIACEQLDLFA